MSSPIYYRRQAMSSLALAEATNNPEVRLQLTELAYEYLKRADAIAHEQLDSFIASKNVGVSVLTRS